jgi:hypothetical protein
MGENVLDLVKTVDRKVDEIRELLRDIFLTPSEYSLTREVDRIVKEKRLEEFIPLDDI